MDVYERFIEQMRKCGEHNNPPIPKIGVMGAKGKIKVGALTLDTDDYLMDCNLRIGGGKVYYHKEQPLDTSHNATLAEYKNNILSEGDNVLVLKLSGTEKYVLIAKVVSPV